jgi:hypothetical protein
MSKPIYKFFMARFTEAWHQLSEEEQKSLAAKVDATLEKVGAKRLMQFRLVLGTMVACWSRGVPGHRGGPETHCGPEGAKLVSILREFDLVGH